MAPGPPRPAPPPGGPRPGRPRREQPAGGGRPGDGRVGNRREDRRPGGAPRSTVGAPLAAVGPLGAVIKSDGSLLRAHGDRAGLGANALILLRRVAFLDAEGRIHKDVARVLLRWAAEYDLGQDPGLVEIAAARRERALAELRERGEAVGLLVTPEWRLAVGLGNRTNPHEIGLSLHGTYGWPIIPGTSLKGLTAAWAAGSQRAGAARADAKTLDRIFGTPRPKSEAKNDAEIEAPDGERTDDGEVRRGSVCFLDALPAGGPVGVAVDVLTPHVQPYYGDRSATVPPAEYHNPVPSEFLVVSGGTFAVDLTGPARDVERAAAWCHEALTELGAGAKTSAGYGYVRVEFDT